MSRPPISVVVPTRDRGALLTECLRALADELDDADEVIVVDSASRTPLNAAVVDCLAGARIVRLEEKGASRARNAGWRTCRHAVVAFIDDDCLVSRGWADTLAVNFTAPAIAFVVGRIDVPENERDIDQPVSVLTLNEPRTIASPKDVIGASANMAARVDALGAVGGFDERMGPGCRIPAAEDLDLLDRLIAAGFAGRYDPAAAVSHRQWRKGMARLRLHWNYGKGAGSRMAKALLTNRRRARELVPGVLRLGGVATVARDVRSGTPRNRLPGLAWRMGAIVGVFSGLRHLRPPEWTVRT